MHHRRIARESEDARRLRRRRWAGVGAGLVLVGGVIPLFPAARTLNGIGAAFLLAAVGAVLLVPALFPGRWRPHRTADGRPPALAPWQVFLARTAALLAVFVAFAAYCLFFWRVLDPYPIERKLLFGWVALGLALSFDVMGLTLAPPPGETSPPDAPSGPSPHRLPTRRRWPPWRRAAALLTGLGMVFVLLGVLAGRGRDYDPIGGGIVVITMGGVAGVLLVLSFTAGTPWRRRDGRSAHAPETDDRPDHRVPLPVVGLVVLGLLATLLVLLV